MKSSVELGKNRTGIQMSPIDSQKMIEIASQTPATPMPDLLRGQVARTRTEYIQDADPIGTVPLPGTLRGFLAAGKEKIQGIHAEALIDKLGERLAFERTGARLYEIVMTKCHAEDRADLLPDLIRIHASELEHFDLVKRTIEKLGADPTAQTPCADAAAVASKGLLQLAADPRSNVTQSMQTLMTAELVDNASWELLIEMARLAKMDEVADSFEKALEAEQEHLMTIRRLFRACEFEELGFNVRKEEAKFAQSQ